MGYMPNEYNEYNKIEIVNGKTSYKNEFYVKNDVGSAFNPTVKPTVYNERNDRAEPPRERKSAKNSEAVTQIVTKIAAVVGAVTVGVVSADALGIITLDKNKLYSRYLTQDEIRLELFPYEEGLSYFFEIFEYTPTGDINVTVSDGNVKKSQPVQLGREEGLFGEGYFENLTPEKDYLFSITDGKYILWEQSFFTAAEEEPFYPVITDDMIEYSITPASNEVSYNFVVTGYEPAGDITVTVTDGINTFENFVRNSADGLFSQGYFTDLTPSTNYTFSINDNGYSVWSTVFETEAFRLTEDQVSLELGAGADYVSYYFEIIDYEPKGDIVVTITGNGVDYSRKADKDLKTSTISAEGECYNLEEETEYTFSILDDGKVVYTQTFTTEKVASSDGSTGG